MTIYLKWLLQARDIITGSQGGNEKCPIEQLPIRKHGPEPSPPLPIWKERQASSSLGELPGLGKDTLAGAPPLPPHNHTWHTPPSTPRQRSHFPLHHQQKMLTLSLSKQTENTLFHPLTQNKSGSSLTGGRSCIALKSSSNSSKVRSWR